MIRQQQTTKIDQIEKYSFQRRKQELIRQLLAFAVSKQQQKQYINKQMHNQHVMRADILRKDELKESLINKLTKLTSECEEISVKSDSSEFKEAGQSFKLNYLKDFLKKWNWNGQEQQKKKQKQIVKVSTTKQILGQSHREQSDKKEQDDDRYHVISNFFKDNSQQNIIHLNTQPQEYHHIKNASRFGNESTMAFSKLNKIEVTPHKQQKTERLTPKELKTSPNIHKSYFMNQYSGNNRDSSEQDRLANRQYEKGARVAHKERIVSIKEGRTQRNSEDHRTGRFNSGQKSNQKNYQNDKNQSNSKIISRGSKGNSKEQLEYSQSIYLHSENSLLPSVLKANSSRKEQELPPFQPEQSYENLFNSEVTRVIYKTNSFQSNNPPSIKKVRVDLSTYTSKGNNKVVAGNENIKNMLNSSKEVLVDSENHERKIIKSLDRRSKCSEVSEESAMTFNNNKEVNSYKPQEDEYQNLKKSIKKMEQKVIPFENTNKIFKINEQKFRKELDRYNDEAAKTSNNKIFNKTQSIFKKKIDYKNEQGTFSGSQQLNLRRFLLNKQGNPLAKSIQDNLIPKNNDHESMNNNLSDVQEQLSSFDENQLKSQRESEQKSGIMSYLRSHLLKFTSNNDKNIKKTLSSHKDHQKEQPLTNKKKQVQIKLTQENKDIKSLSSIKKSSSNQKQREDQSIENSFFCNPSSLHEKDNESSCSFMKAKEKVTQNGLIQINNIVRQSVKNVQRNLINAENQIIKNNPSWKPQEQNNKNQEGSSNNDILPKSMIFQENSHLMQTNARPTIQEKHQDAQQQLQKQKKLYKIFGKAKIQSSQSNNSKVINMSMDILDKQNQECYSHPSSVKKVSERSYDKSQLLRHLEQIKDDSIINNLFNKGQIQERQHIDQYSKDHQKYQDGRYEVQRRERIQVDESDKKEDVLRKIITINLQDYQDVNESSSAISFSKLINNTEQEHSQDLPFLSSFRIDKSTSKKQVISEKKVQGKVTSVKKIEMNLQPIEPDQDDFLQDPSFKKKNTSNFSSNKDNSILNLSEMQDDDSEQEQKVQKKTTFEMISKPITKLAPIIQEQLQESQLNRIKISKLMSKASIHQQNSNKGFDESDMKSLQDEFLKDFSQLSSQSNIAAGQNNNHAEKQHLKIIKENNNKPKIILKASVKSMNKLELNKDRSESNKNNLFLQFQSSSSQSKQLLEDIKQSLHKIKERLSSNHFSQSSSIIDRNSTEKKSKKEVKKITIEINANKNIKGDRDKKIPLNQQAQMLQFPSSQSSNVKKNYSRSSHSKKNHEMSAILSDISFEQDQNEKKAYKQFCQSLNVLQTKMKHDARIGLAMPE